MWKKISGEKNCGIWEVQEEFLTCKAKGFGAVCVSA